MCTGFPCKCCRPVTAFDTDFDEAKPWKCFFQDMQEENPIDLAQMRTIIPKSGELEFLHAFFQDYRFPGARPIRKPCAAGFYTPPTFQFAAGGITFAKSILARMKFDQPELDVWHPQRIKIRVDYSYQLPYVRGPGTVVGTNAIMVIVGDEHDDSDVQYSTSYVAWPAIVFRIQQSFRFPGSGFIDCFLFSPEGGLIGIFSGHKMPGTWVGFSSVNVTETGSFELTIERLASSTRFSLELNGSVVGLTNATVDDATEWLEMPMVIFRESPHWRVLVGGMQFLPRSINRIPAKFDRIAVESVKI